MLGCFTKPRILAPNMAHDDDGDPGMGRSPDANGERLDMGVKSPGESLRTEHDVVMLCKHDIVMPEQAWMSQE